MERSEGGRRTLEQALVHWRSVGLVGACLAGGLTLTVMVIGSTPTIGGPVAAATEAVMAQAADPSATLAGEPATTEATPASTEVSVESVPELLAVPVGVDTAAVPGASSAPVEWPTRPVATGRAAPLQPSAAPSQPVAPAPNAAAPTPDAPSVPVPTIAAKPPTTAAPTTAAPTTAAPTTAAPTTAAPTTAAPTTAAPVALSYPTYTVSGVSGVSLKFDGSSISVASVSPQANWVYEIATNGPRTVEIKFFNVATGSDREFHASVEGGRIKVET